MRAILIAHSSASAPEFWKNTVSAKLAAHEPVGELLAFRNAIEIGYVPDLMRLLSQRLDQMRMGMSQRIDSNAGCKIQVPFTRGREQPSALAPLESEIDPRIGWQ